MHGVIKKEHNNNKKGKIIGKFFQYMIHDIIFHDRPPTTDRHKNNNAYLNLLVQQKRIQNHIVKLDNLNCFPLSTKKLASY